MENYHKNDPEIMLAIKKASEKNASGNA